MADINSLDLREPDPIDWEHYDTGERKPIVVPTKGMYQVVSTEPVEVGATRSKYLMIKFPSFKIVSAPVPEFEGAEIRFTNLSVQKWPNREGSPLGDYLKAHGVQGQRTNPEYVAAVESCQGRVAEAGVDWRAYCKDCGTELKGMDKFPLAADGTRQPFIECPTKCQDNTDPNNPRPKRLWANTVITYFKARA